MKVVTIVGAQPQFIKAAILSRAIKRCNKENSKNIITEVIVHTGQHFDENMSQIFFEEMQMSVPNYNLDINGLRHGAMTGRMLEEIENILLFEKPDWVLVYGDTNSTLAGALAASKLQLKVAHVEAGLRSFNMEMPEEINRILTDRISKILFCPTDVAVENLNKEGFNSFESTIVKAGDVMYDAALFYSNASKKPQIPINEESFILTTIHRQENTDNLEKLTSILESINMVSREMKIILPIHPRTSKIIEKLSLKLNKNIIMCKPVSYLEMIWLLKNCSIVMTDSGGLQKEAFFFKKPCITLREESEWIELIELGVNYVVGSSLQKILNAYEKAKTKKNNFASEPYGNGTAANQIIEKLLEHI